MAFGSLVVSEQLRDAVLGEDLGAAEALVDRALQRHVQGTEAA